jgi:NADH-quinone oxidoreductase subunit M
VKSHLRDLNAREWAAILPLLILMVWLGTATQTFLPSIGAANARILEQSKVRLEIRVQTPPALKELAHVR